MIYPDVTLEEWLKKYPELEVISKSCDNCDAVMSSTIPYLNKDYAGLIAPDCKCQKNKTTCMISVTRTIEVHNEWVEALTYL